MGENILINQYSSICKILPSGVETYKANVGRDSTRTPFAVGSVKR